MAIKKKPTKKAVKKIIPPTPEFVADDKTLGEEKTIRDKKNVLEALRLSLGVVSTACDKVNLSRSTYYKWLHNDPEFAAEVADVDELILDFGETNLFKLINKGNPKCTMFLLETRGRKRGYVKKREIEAYGKDGKALYPGNPYAGMTDAEIEDELRSLDDES